MPVRSRKGSPRTEALLDPEARAASGRALRERLPRGSHAEFKRPRRDPIAILIESSKSRVPQLLPIRYGRMLRSPFTFYRGAAAIMADDLARTPKTGIRVQTCGDCHLLNFGGFATPERRLIFDINDFDETLPAPWEWDVKRLATSFVIAGRNNGLKRKPSRAAAVACARSYRERMAEFATRSALDVWYASVDSETVFAALRDPSSQADMRKGGKKLRAKSVAEHDFPELVTLRNGKLAIRDNPPLIYHAQDQDLALDVHFGRAFEEYRDTLADDRRTLLDRYRVLDVALKVVGVGSVGTRCGIILLMGLQHDPLFLQVKEAQASVLEAHAGKSVYPNHGERVVMGQRLTQPASDIFLGWTAGEVVPAHFYVRQLRDMKVKIVVETMDEVSLVDYGALCGWVLARAHAKAGDALKIASYLGKKSVFDEAIGDFAEAYADQNERDHAALVQAVSEGRIVAAADA